MDHSSRWLQTAINKQKHLSLIFDQYFRGLTQAEHKRKSNQKQNKMLW